MLLSRVAIALFIFLGFLSLAAHLRLSNPNPTEEVKGANARSHFLETWRSRRTIRLTISHTRPTRMESRSLEGIGTPPPKGYFIFPSLFFYHLVHDFVMFFYFSVSFYDLRFLGLWLLGFFFNLLELLFWGFVFFLFVLSYHFLVFGDSFFHEFMLYFLVVCGFIPFLCRTFQYTVSTI